MVFAGSLQRHEMPNSSFLERDKFEIDKELSLIHLETTSEIFLDERDIHPSLSSSVESKETIISRLSLLPDI